MKIEMEVSEGLKQLLNPQNKEHVEKTLRHARDELGLQIKTKIKEKGFAPRDTGRLAESHHVMSNEKETLITTDRVANDGRPLWHYIINGHRTLNTEKSRRAWFWYLKNVLGGNYTRKTSGPPGYVPPNRYHERAINAVNMNAVLAVIERELLKF